MATIAQSLALGVLQPYELPDWASGQPIRPLLMPPSFFDWVDHTAELYDPALMIGRRTIFDHLLIMLNEFRCAPRIAGGDLRRMMPTKKGVWKLHPPGLRLYGWCYQPHSLVLVTGALESDTKADKKLNDKKRMMLWLLQKTMPLPKRF